jgi:GNAT superfamily N-acetyltransferase
MCLDMGYQIRRASDTDVASIVASVSALFREDGGRQDRFMDVGWPGREGWSYYADAVADDASLCLVAELTGPERTAIGHLVGRMRRPDSLRPGAVVAVLESMRVDHDHRGTGAGTQLIASFREWARSRGANEATVHAYAANAPALAFYRARGFAPRQVSLTLDMSPDSG